MQLTTLSEAENRPPLSKDALLYVCYGEGPHQLEIVYSITSACYLTPDENRHILVYTDQPDVFADLPVEVRLVPSEVWELWSAPYGFKHRRKIVALQHALSTSMKKVVMVDGDTWFQASADRLFSAVEVGKSIMHIREGSLQKVESPLFDEVRALIDDFSSGTVASDHKISNAADMWNSGVVGLHSSDRHLIDSALALCDSLCEKSRLHVLEQIAFSWILQSQTELSEVPNLVFHYWPPWIHVPFRARLRSLLEESKAIPQESRFEYLYRFRPRPGLRHKGKVILKRCAQAIGLIRGRCRTNEW